MPGPNIVEFDYCCYSLRLAIENLSRDSVAIYLLDRLPDYNK
jgi:hypothetical protein